MKISPSLLAVLILISSTGLQAQNDSLLNMLNNSVKPGKQYVAATFKATHIVNMQTIEAPGPGALNFVIQHRFGQLNSGGYNFFGLDNATLRLGFDYGISNRLSAGIGRSNTQKTFDGYLKYKLLRQSEGEGAFPVSVSVLAAINHYTLREPDKPFLNAKYRSSYIGQLLIARKFNSRLSVQLTPTIIHFNLVPTTPDKNDVFSMGAGARWKVTRRMSINVEYNYLLPDQLPSLDLKNSLSFGWDIETGGHVFQLVFSNSQGMVESQYIGQTTGSWSKGDIYFGFNVARNFNLTKKAKGKL